MSTPNPVEVIAEHTWSDEMGCDCRDDVACWGREDYPAHLIAKLTDAGYSIVRVECDGSGTCPVSVHIHGCFADVGNCDNPDDHVCDCGTCKAIEAARAERAAAAEGEKP